MKASIHHQTQSPPYLPLQHTIELQWVVVVSVCFLCDQRILCIKCPAFCERGVVRSVVQPTNNTSTGITKELFKSLHLKRENNKLDLKNWGTICTDIGEYFR